jgi:type I restriction enzyme S subunit
MELTITKYKKTEVGNIPEDWNVKLLGEVLKIKHGKDQKNVQKNDGIYPILGTGGLMGYASKFIYNKESVLIGRKGTIDKPKFMDSPFWTVDTLFYSEIFDGFSGKYIYYNFLLIDWYSHNEASGVPSLNSKTIEGIPIAVPPTLTEQKAIATALSDVDDLINNLEKLIAKKKAIKQGAMQQLLTPPHKGGKRLAGFSGVWETKLLGEIGSCIIGLTYSPDNVVNDGTLVLRSSNVQENKLAFHDNVYVNSTIPTNLRVKEGDILICVRNGSRQLIGKCAILDKRVDGQTFGAFMSVFRTEYSKFVFQMFQSNDIKRQIDENLGATINQITNKVLNSFSIPFPSIKEQEAITKILCDMDDEILKLEYKKDKYNGIKQGMMQELLTGKTRLV